MQSLPRSKKLMDIIAKAATNNFAVPRLGVIVSDSDPAGLYRFLVQIPSLGWNTNDKAPWCHVSDKKGYVSPKNVDYVIVQFMDGKIDNPFISGCANHMKDMISNLYNANTDVIYEMPDVISIIHDRQANEMKIGNTGFNFAARLDDQIKSVTADDAAFWTTFMGGILTWLSTHTHAVPGVMLGGPGTITSASLNPTPANPGSITGKITAASDQVKIGDK